MILCMLINAILPDDCLHNLLDILMRVVYPGMCFVCACHDLENTCTYI